MKTTSTYGAELLSVMGDDLTVVNAARVSFDKESRWANEDDWLEFDADLQLKDADARLIAFLARNGHWTPFAHPQLSFRVSAPIFVARQLQKHQVGLAWNEVSRRYVDSEPTIYVPTEWRAKADNVKQGSSDVIIETTSVVIQEYEQNWGWNDCRLIPSEAYDRAVELAVEVYEAMLKAGICPEQARMVLPQSMMTEWVWTGSLAAFARVVNQRLDSHAQRECRPVAQDIAKALRINFPVSWSSLANLNDQG
jgi:thymidylate synthase (FAD)